MQGKTINGFTLQRLLGVGGMAEVWYAENEIGLGAAVKIISEELSHSAQMQERFRNEAKVMVKLDHPNIRRVYGFGNIDGRPCIVMEYLEGNDLKALLKKGRRFTQEELVKWWNQLVDALSYTHAQNIVHRDIKPSNIFIDQRGNVKLLDFGIAKIADTTTGTQTGSTLGTRIYMSPEQVRDPKRVGSPSDVYSLAVSFVHLLTGKAPYDSTTNSDYDIQECIVRKPLDLSKLPAEWRDFLSPYLAKDPKERPALRVFEAAKKDATKREVPVETKPKAVPNVAVTADADEGTIAEEVAKPTRPQTQPTYSKDKPVPETAPKPKSRKGLWIGFGVAIVTLVAVLLLRSKPPVTVGKEGVFTVSESEKMIFAKGNLQYNPSTKQWRNADHPWDMRGEANSNISPTYSGWIDLFGWGTGDDPTKSSEDNSDYPSFTDWGWSYWSGWRTLEAEEWDYVFNKRSTTSGIRYAKARVNNVNGVILLPDNWNVSTYRLSNINKSNASFSSNSIRAYTWNNTFDPAGAVFLPAAGCREGTSVDHVGSDGYYWSSTYFESNHALSVFFWDGSLYTDIFHYRYYGFSVRLVRPAEN